MDLLITIFALLVAIYAVIPRERQLDLRLQIGLPDRVLVSVGSLAILYLEFNEFCTVHGWTFKGPWPSGITPRNAMYLVMAAVTIILWIRIKFSRLTKGKIQEFRELVEQSYWSESYGELLTLLRMHLRQLFKISESQSLLLRLRSRLKPLSGEELDPNSVERLIVALGQVDPAAPPKERKWLAQAFRNFCASALRPLVSGAFKLIPDTDKARAIARDIIRGILLSPKFASALTRTRPYLGLEIIREAAHSQDRGEFVDVYLQELMRNTQSALYAELRNNQNCGQFRYHLSDSNRLLCFFLSDVKVAEDNRIYKPIGDFAVAYLRDLGRNPGSDPYNIAMDSDFEKVGVWSSPLFVTIRFFDIMVKEALFQGIEWHMWLYYMPLLVEGIVRNYRLVDPNADPTGDRPIRYSFLLHEVFSAMRDWVAGLEGVPHGQANATLKRTRADHENGNIPKSSILALSQCSRRVLESDHISDRLKRSLMDIVFTLYFDLRADPDFEGYATVLREALSVGGFYRRRRDPSTTARSSRLSRRKRTNT
ncbi:MAG: hypothetical protein WA755_09160 [Candidatus Acidiferrales bacterium]